MPDALKSALEARLQQRQMQSLMRKRRLLESPQASRIMLDGYSLLSFASNDYLGLANHPQLVSAMQQASSVTGVGAGASNLITGHHRFHDELEKNLAEFVNKPAALLFTTGYMANIGVISALMGREDVVFSDKLNHASLNDGALLSRAKHQRFAHCDAANLARLLQKSDARHKLVVTDAVFSMDGDIAPLPEYLALCERYDAYLYVDDAHGFGVLGEQGRGTLSHFKLQSPRLISMGTLGKAAGVAGAFVAAETSLISYLMQYANTYVYTTSAPPALSATLLNALEVIAHGDVLRTHLQHLITVLHEGLRTQHWRLMATKTPIQPLFIGDTQQAVALSEYLQQQGIIVPVIRPPTVPNGTARLRISLSAAHSIQDVETLAHTLNEAEVMFLKSHESELHIERNR